jgi:hypothetical protein
MTEALILILIALTLPMWRGAFKLFLILIVAAFVAPFAHAQDIPFQCPTLAPLEAIAADLSNQGYSNTTRLIGDDITNRGQVWIGEGGVVIVEIGGACIRGVYVAHGER